MQRPWGEDAEVRSGKQAGPTCARREDKVRDWDFSLSLGEASRFQAGNDRI